MTIPQPSWNRASRDGYPFGSRTLILRSTPVRRDSDLGATLHDGEGRQVGIVRTENRRPWNRVAMFLGNGAAASWDFVVIDMRGLTVLKVARPRIKGWRDRHERFLVRAPDGRHIGRLLQNNSYTAALKTFDLQADDNTVARTTADYQKLAGENTLRTATVHDARGYVATDVVQRRASSKFFGGDYYDYTMTFAYPPGEPLGQLCVAVLLAEYFHRRTEQGGTVANVPTVPHP